MRLTGRDVRIALSLATLIVAANAAYVASKLGFVHRVRDVLETDHKHYIDMAVDPAAPEDPPYCFRVAVPALARGLIALGVPLNTAFYAITQASLIAFLACVYLFLRARGLEGSLAGLILILMGLTQGAVRWFVYQYWMSDPLCLALVAAAALAIQLDSAWMVAVVIAFAAGFVRESFVLVLPFAFFHTLRRHDLKTAMARTVAISAAFFAVSLSLHAAIAPRTPDDWWSGVTDSMAFRANHFWSEQWYVLGVGTWGIFLSLALADVKTLAARVRDNLDLASLVVAAYGTLIISNNTERPLAYAWPAVAAAGAGAIRALSTRCGVQVGRLAALCVGAQAVLYGSTRFYDLSGASLYQPANPAVAALMAFLWLVWALQFARLSTN